MSQQELFPVMSLDSYLHNQWMQLKEARQEAEDVRKRIQSRLSVEMLLDVSFLIERLYSMEKAAKEEYDAF